MRRLIDSLFAVLIGDPAGGLASQVHADIEAASAPELARALEALAPHRVLPLLCHRLSALGLLEVLPEEARTRLLGEQRETRAINRLFLLTAAAIVREAERRGEPLVLLKGLVFADSYYPDFSTRPMGDLDVVSAPGRGEALYALLSHLGFSRVADHVVQDHAVAFINAQGVACDAHNRFEMFEPTLWPVITREVSLARVRGPRVRVLEPNAMVAHLVMHMDGHRTQLGFVLLWLLDLAFVVRRHRAELELPHVRALFDNPRCWPLFLSMLRMFEAFGDAMPAGFEQAALGVPALSLRGVLRARRLRPWGLPAPLGWMRLAAYHLSLREYEGRPVPSLEDLLLWPLDVLSARVTPRLARS